MKKIYNDTFEKIYIKEASKERIRERLEEEMSVKRGISIWRWGAAAVALAIVLFAVPYTRNYAFAAVENLRKMFTFSDGTEVVIEVNENETSASVEISDEDYIRVEDERLYFVLEGERKDITDEVGSDKFFRYEQILEYGNRSVILIGGKAPAYGWVELLFDEDGRYLTNRMHVPMSEQEWVEKAMHAEGVPTGNPLYDLEK